MLALEQGLCIRAAVLVEESRRIRADIHASRLRCPVRRLQRLAAGANDDEVRSDSPPAHRETSKRHCPSCHSGLIEPTGRATAENGLIKVDFRCGACAFSF